MNAEVKTAVFETGLRGVFQRVSGGAFVDYHKWVTQQWAQWAADNGVDGNQKKTWADRDSFKRWIKAKYPEPRNEPTYAAPVERCRGKVIFDKRGAETAKNARMDKGAGNLRSYHCEVCNGWHLTHKEYIRR